MYQQYAPLLLCGGLIDFLPEDLPASLPNPFTMFSFLFLDGGGKSKLGIHTDTKQAVPCTCACDSLYPKGCYDFEGAQLTWANGVWGDSYGREDCVILAGHVSMHTVCPLTPPRVAPREELAGLPMLRGSLVHWSKAGAEHGGYCERWENAVQDEMASSNPGGSMWHETWSHVREQCRLLMGVYGKVEVAAGFRLWRPDAPHIVQLVGKLGLVLRLRGGAAKRRCKPRGS